MIKRLKELGFAQVIALDAAQCCDELNHGTLLLAIWTYRAEREPHMSGAWIHPYYPASQKAYRAAVQAVQEAGEGAALRPDIRVKPIFARLPMFTQGRNTLSYLTGVGSRFHVQIIHLDEELTERVPLEDKAHELHCGSCQACMKACPNGAIDREGFHREKCIRNWMLSGKSVPEDVRSAMGSRLIGCDECQRCCPHNPEPDEESHQLIRLEEILADSKAVCEELRPLIGANLSLPNRVLSQGCIMAGSARRRDLLPVLDELGDIHPSPVVREHASWAAAFIRDSEK